MSTETDSKEVTESTSLPADVTDDSCRLEFIEIVPLTRDTDGPCTTECDSGGWSAEVKQENLPVVKQEPDDVCCIICCILCIHLFTSYVMCAILFAVYCVFIHFNCVYYIHYITRLCYSVKSYLSLS